MTIRALFENAAAARIRRTAVLLAAGVLVLTSCFAVHAEEAGNHPDMKKDGGSTLSLAMTDRATGKAVPGGRLRIYQIAEMPDDGAYQYVLTEDFAACGGLSVSGSDIVLEETLVKEYAAYLAELEAEAEKSEAAESDTESVEDMESAAEDAEDAESAVEDAENTAEDAESAAAEPETGEAADVSYVTAKYLQQYIRDNGVAGKDPTVAELGEVSWSKLPLGIYLVSETEPVEGYADIKPFFMTIPEAEYDADGMFIGYEYDVDAVPKMDKVHTPVIY